MKARAASALVAALAGAAGLSWLSGEAAPVAAPVASSAAPRQPAGTAAACSYVEGEALAYTLQSEVSVAEEPGAEVDRFSAVLSLRVLDARRDRSTLRAGLSQVELLQRLSQREDRVSHSLDAGFELEVGRDCRIEALRFPSDWSPAAGLLVAGSLQLHEYVVRAAPTWEVEQTDGVGQHRARYRRSGAHVQRRKLYYASEGLDAFGMTLSLPVAEASARFDDRGLLSSAVRERLRISVGGEVRADLWQRSTLMRERERFFEPHAAGALARYEPAAPQAADRLPEAPSDAAALAARYEDLVGRLSRWTVRDAREMAGLLVARPERMRELVALLGQRDLDGGQRASVFWALELLGTPAAKGHLVDLLGAPLPHDRIRAASALASAGDASVEDGEALLALHRGDDEPSVAASALLAFGALGAEASPEVKAYVRGELQAELSAADSADSIRVALQAIGNTGDAQVLDAVASYLEDPDPTLRATAASALRGMGRDAVAPLQLALDSETSPQAAVVIARTLTGLGAPSPADVAWAGTRLAAASDATAVRRPLIEWLGSSDTGEARAALAAHFHAEPSSELRRLIGRYLPVAELVR